jgi:hypothetical protein
MMHNRKRKKMLENVFLFEIDKPKFKWFHFDDEHSFRLFSKMNKELNFGKNKKQNE